MLANWLAILVAAVTAAGTLALWWVGRSSLQKTDRILQQNAELIAATNAEAQAAKDTIQEMHLARELGWRPHLEFGPLPNDVLVRNVGRGIALHTRLARWAVHPMGRTANVEARISNLFILAPGESTQLTLSAELTPGAHFDI